MLLDAKPLEQLPGHEFLTVTHSNDLASVDSLDLGCVRVGDLAAANNRNFKHAAPFAGNFRNTG
jgi:hypothetical protein